MTYKTILANLQDPKSAAKVMRAATGLARDMGAHLIGLHVLPKVQYFYATAAVQVATEVFEAEQKYFDDQAEEIRKIFEREAPGDIVTEWRCIEAEAPSATSEAVRHAMCADLIVTGQVDPEKGLEADIAAPERLVMETGRPVLVLPYAGEFKTIGKDVLVAWNAKRESARAVFDSLPLLKAAKSVRLLWINPDAAEGGAGTGTPGSELAATLDRHGVKVETSQSVTHEISVGDELLSRAADHGADLLVMGAYGHSRVREYVFGGATRHILRHMTLPVLMAH